MRRWFSRLRALLDRGLADAELDEELRFHLDAQIEENVARGMSPEEARRVALRDFGGVEQTKEAHRDARGIAWFESLGRDIRYAARGLRRNPGFTAVAVLTLALGIGANTAIFTVIHAVMLKPLPYPDADRLVSIWTISPPIPGYGGNAPRRTQLARSSWIDQWRSSSESFRNVALYMGWRFTLTGNGGAERVTAVSVSASFFETLGVQPALGRSFTPEECVRGADRVVILSDEFWRDRFGGDASALGATVQLDGVPRLIVGIMPPGLRLHFTTVWPQPDLYAPISAQDALPGRNVITGFTIGRLRDGMEPEAARDELNAIYRRLDPTRSADVTSISDEIGQPARPTLLVLLGAAACVLLIACVNLTNLLLARSLTRRKEFGVRTVLGAGPVRLAGQSLAETLAIALLGGACGLFISHWTVQLILSLYPQTLPRTENLQPEPAVFGFAFLVALATGLLVGLAPAFHASKVHLNEAVKEGATGRGGSRYGGRLRNCLAAAEVALAIILLSGAGLLLNSLLKLTAVDPQFRRENLILVDLTLPTPAYAAGEAQNLFAERLLERVRALPDVRSAGITNSPPLTPNAVVMADFTVLGQPKPEGRLGVYIRAITPQFLETMGTQLIAGRNLSASDSDAAMLVNEAFARRWLVPGKWLGARIEVEGHTGTVVGVVADVKNRDLAAATDEELYLPFHFMPAPFLGLAIYTDDSPEQLAGPLRQELQSLDPTIAMGDVLTTQQILSDEVARPRFNAVLVGSFAFLAMTLAFIGIYGVISYGVAQRTHEIGVRMAMGARRGDIVRFIALGGLTAPVAGIVLGLIGALAATPLLKSFLFEVEPHDPATYLLTAVLTLLVVLTASVVPTIRALRVEPLKMLRYE